MSNIIDCEERKKNDKSHIQWYIIILSISSLLMILTIISYSLVVINLISLIIMAIACGVIIVLMVFAGFKTKRDYEIKTNPNCNVGLTEWSR